MVSKDGNTEKYIESKEEVETYVAKLKYSLTKPATKINFQEKRKVDENRQEEYTNKFTIGDLFPDESPKEALKRELNNIMVEDYIETVKDLRYPKRSDMRVFGKVYKQKDVYIKIRVEIISDDYIFVMSFHYSTRSFSDETFPYKRR